MVLKGKLPKNFKLNIIPKVVLQEDQLVAVLHVNIKGRPYIFLQLENLRDFTKYMVTL